RRDHLGGMTNVAKDDNDNLVAVIAGSTKKAKGQVIYVRTSTDEGLTWSAPLRVSPVRNGDRRVIASFPTIAGTGNGDFRLWWQDNYQAINGWNTWYMESTDNGATWSPKARISDAINGAFYKSRKGYLADYGDYGGIDVMSDGRTIATWGEGESYWGAGGTWINRQLSR
ncbi:MAG: glycoside hydrolase, partial [Actinobacteria bacterium]|nr:glycoside hydrolase [Actinomycetota bacterium]